MIQPRHRQLERNEKMAEVDPTEARNEALREDQDQRRAEPARHRPDESPPTSKGKPGSATGGIHAAGMPGGGAAIGGIAGTNVGSGDVDGLETDLEDAYGAGIHDNEDPDGSENQGPPYAGRSGGAVGGSPAGMRASGGRTHGGIEPEPGSSGENSIGRITSNPQEPRRPKGK